jgi:glycosyltransferase involved in cell wall biosynthesis
MTNLERGNRLAPGRVLYIGTSYYNNWYLSRELRKRGWKADLLVCSAEGARLYLHGCDYYLEEYMEWDQKYTKSMVDFLEPLLKEASQSTLSPIELRDKAETHDETNELPSWEKNHAAFIRKQLRGSAGGTWLKNLIPLFLRSIRPEQPRELTPLKSVWRHYDILHFTGVNSIRYFYFFNPYLFGPMPIGWDIQLLKRLGMKVVYTNIGCLDGVSQSSFRAWKPEPVCDICRWQDEPEVCSDEKNLAWGKLRNELADYQCTLGGNRADYNEDPRVHEVPEFFCLDPEVWRPDLDIPREHRLNLPEKNVKIYHAVGNYDIRTHSGGKNIKCTHIYLPLIERLKREGFAVDTIFCKDIPGMDVRFYQAQADIVVDMLTFGWFGANIREGMMLGKPCVCFLRPEWLQSMRKEIPAYVDELPVINATPDTVYQVLVDLIKNPDKRYMVGKKGREFAMKWHSSEAGAKRFQKIYTDLLARSSLPNVNPSVA